MECLKAVKVHWWIGGNLWKTILLEMFWYLDTRHIKILVVYTPIHWYCRLLSSYFPNIFVLRSWLSSSCQIIQKEISFFRDPWKPRIQMGFSTINWLVEELWGIVKCRNDWMMGNHDLQKCQSSLFLVKIKDCIVLHYTIIDWRTCLLPGLPVTPLAHLHQHHHHQRSSHITEIVHTTVIELVWESKHQHEEQMVQTPNSSTQPHHICVLREMTEIAMWSLPTPIPDTTIDTPSVFRNWALVCGPNRQHIMSFVSGWVSSIDTADNIAEYTANQTPPTSSPPPTTAAAPKTITNVVRTTMRYVLLRAWHKSTV